MKSMLAITLFAATALAAAAVHAEARTPSDPAAQAPGAKLNGRTFNGPGLVVQGTKFNGFRMNGPGVVLQGNRFNGIRFNGSAPVGFGSDQDDLTLVSVESCLAPSAREWPLSALRTADVTVRLPKR